MNPDDVRHLLATTPDEPSLPADPVAEVHRRIRSRRRQGRLRAGALAVVLIAAGVGATVALPGSHNSGDTAQLHVIAPTPTATPPPSSSAVRPPSSTHTSAVTPTHTPTSTPAALADFAAAKQEWIQGSTAIAADLNNHLGRAVTKLSDALVAGVDNPSAYRSAIASLQSLMAIPDTDVTPAQIKTANADTSALNQFFGTHLYNTPPSSTSPATALPAAPNCDPQLAGSGVRPTLIFFGCATSADELTQIAWSSWTSTGATGTATHAVNNCDPNCATGTYTDFPVTVQLSDPGTIAGMLVFRRIVTTPTTGAGHPETATSPDSWGFVPQQ